MSRNELFRPSTAAEHVFQERLQVGTGGGLESGASGAQEGVGLAQTDQVGGDGALGAVLGAQVPLEGADEGSWIALSMTRNGNQGSGLHSVYGPLKGLQT